MGQFIDRMSTHILKIAPWNSTVNGWTPQKRKSARNWLNGWKHLDFSSKRTYTDGRAKDGAGIYLHVPVLEKNPDSRRSYRVRFRYWPGSTYMGKRVFSVKAELRHVKKGGTPVLGLDWFWIVETGFTGN
jgi:hypothetical protein